MSDIENWSDLDSLLRQAIGEAVVELGERVKNIMIEKIEEHVYNTYVPVAYERDRDGRGFKDSITALEVDIGKHNPMVFVYSRGDKMSLDQDNFKHGSRYVGRDGGEEETDVRDNLADIIAFNLSGNLFGYGHWRERENYFTDTLFELEHNGWLDRTFASILKSKGIDIE